MKGRFARLGERECSTVRLIVDGAPVEALQGDTLMVALLTKARRCASRSSDRGVVPGSA